MLGTLLGSQLDFGLLFNLALNTLCLKAHSLLFLLSIEVNPFYVLKMHKSPKLMELIS